VEETAFQVITSQNWRMSGCQGRKIEPASCGEIREDSCKDNSYAETLFFCTILSIYEFINLSLCHMMQFFIKPNNRVARVEICISDSLV